MRILLATDAFPPRCGGSGWSTYELAKGLRTRGHDVLVVQPRPGTPAGIVEGDYEGIPHVTIGSAAPRVPLVRNYVKNERLHRWLGDLLAGLVRRHDVDLVHGQHVLTGPAAVAAGRTAGVPSVCTVRDYWPVCYWGTLIHDPASDHLCPRCTAGNMTRCVRPRAGAAWPLALAAIPYMRGNLERKTSALSRAGAVIAVSSAIARDLRDRAPELARARLEVIPNAIDLDAIGTLARSRPRQLPGPYAIFVGKLEPNKGVQHLVPAMAAAQVHWPLVVAGDGSIRGQVEADAARAGVDVRMLGWLARDEALGWLAHARLLVFPSHGPESLSRVLIEAGALGIPAAAMDTGGTRDIVRHEETGLLSASADGLARDVARLAGDAGLRARLGEAARAHVAAHFESGAVAARVSSLYDSLVGGAGHARG